jgi:hypothetical protein
MITEPKPARRKRINFPGIAPADPIAAALETDTIAVAADLENALSDLAGMTESSVKIVVYRVSNKGEWEHVKQLSPPLKVGDLINDLEDTYGPGKYAVRILADNRIRTTKFFNIAAPRDGKGSLFGGPDGLNTSSLLKMLLDRDNKPNTGGQDMMLLMMKMQQDANAAMMQMQQRSSETLMTLIATLTANRGDPSDQFLKSAEIIKALQGPQTTAKDILETLTMFRDVTGDGGNAGGFLGLAEKFLPAMAAMADAARQGSGQVAPGAAPAALPAPEATAHRAPPPPVPGAASSPPAGPAGAAPGHPIVSLIKPEIEFFMGRGHDPELAAEAVADVLRAKGITAEALFAFGLELQGTDGDYVGRLQRLGLDVSAHRAWFESMLATLAEIYTEPDDGAEPGPGEFDAGGPGPGELDAGEPAGGAEPGAAYIQPLADRARANGSAADPGPHESPGPARKSANPGKKSGRPAH